MINLFGANRRSTDDFLMINLFELLRYWNVCAEPFGIPNGFVLFSTALKSVFVLFSTALQSVFVPFSTALKSVFALFSCP